MNYTSQIKIGPVLIAIQFLTISVFADTDKFNSIQLGDTFENTVQVIGQPDEVVAKELTESGKSKITYLYHTSHIIQEEVIQLSQKSVPTNERAGLIPSLLSGRGLSSNKVEPLGMERALQIVESQRKKNPPYLLTFTDGKLSSIQRNPIGE